MLHSNPRMLFLACLLLRKISRCTGRPSACRIFRHHDSRENPLGTDVQEAGGAKRERLAHGDFRSFFFGEVSRTDISGRFDVAPAGVVRALARDHALGPGNPRFDGGTKTYRATDAFRPLFEHSLDRVLTALSSGFGDELIGVASILMPCEYTVPLNQPAIEVLAAVTRAVSRRRFVSGLRSDSPPIHPRPELAVLDYPMINGVLQVRTMAALAGYVMSRWSVDCSEGHSLRGPEYCRWLRNRAALDGVVSALIAPGYVSGESADG